MIDIVEEYPEVVSGNSVENKILYLLCHKTLLGKEAMNELYKAVDDAYDLFEADMSCNKNLEAPR